MTKVRISGDDPRKGEDGTAYVTWGEAQALAAAGKAEILQGDDEGGTEADGAEVAAASDAEPDYDDMTRAELDALAKERGIDVSDAKTKADVIAALKG